MFQVCFIILQSSTFNVDILLEVTRVIYKVIIAEHLPLTKLPNRRSTSYLFFARLVDRQGLIFFSTFLFFNIYLFADLIFNKVFLTKLSLPSTYLTCTFYSLGVFVFLIYGSLYFSWLLSSAFIAIAIIPNRRSTSYLFFARLVDRQGLIFFSTFLFFNIYLFADLIFNKIFLTKLSLPSTYLTCTFYSLGVFVFLIYGSLYFSWLLSSAFIAIANDMNETVSFKPCVESILSLTNKSTILEIPFFWRSCLVSHLIATYVTYIHVVIIYMTTWLFTFGVQFHISSVDMMLNINLANRITYFPQKNKS